MSSSFLQNINAPGANKPAPPKAKGKTAFEEAISSKVQQVKPPTVYDWQQMAPGSGGIDKWNSRWTPNGFQVPGTSPDKYDGRGLTDVYGRGIYGKKGKAQKPGATAEGGSKESKVTTNQVTQTNANGVEQTFTNTSAIRMPGLEDADLSGIANFNGPSFPTQAETNKITDGYSFTASEFLTDPKNADGSAFEAPGGTPTTTNIAINGNTFNPNTFEKPGEGAPAGLDGFKPGGKFAGAPTATEGLSGALSDTSGLKYDASKYKGGLVANGEDLDFNTDSPLQYAQSGEEMRRRSAFLDAPDSMEGMQRVAAGMGMGNQGLRNFANVDGVAKEMSSKKRREILNAAPGEAQALKDKWVQSLKTSNESEPQTASSAQNPTKPSGTADFNVDAKLNLPAEAGAVDYMNNNKADDFGIGNKTKLNPDNFTNTGLNYGSFQTQKLGL